MGQGSHVLRDQAKVHMYLMDVNDEESFQRGLRGSLRPSSGWMLVSFRSWLMQRTVPLTGCELRESLLLCQEKLSH